MKVNQVLGLGLGLFGVGQAARTTTITIFTGTCPNTNPTSAFISNTVSLYTTTDSQGHTITGSTTIPISPPPVTTYTTTDSRGQTTVVTSTQSGSIPPVTLITTTNSNGQTSVITSTQSNPPVTLITTTNSNGQTSVITSTQPNVPATTSSAFPAGPSSPCPVAPNTGYTSTSGGKWEVYCLTDFFYNDLPSVKTSTFDQCMAACDAYVPAPKGDSFDQPCVAVTWVETNPNGDNCYLKSAITTVQYGTPQYSSAKKFSYFPPNVSLLPAGTATAAPSGMTGITGGTATTTGGNGGASSLQPTFTSYQAATAVTIANSSYFTIPDGRGNIYSLQAGVSFSYYDLPSVNVPTFNDCVYACDAWNAAPKGDSYDQPCVAVTYVGFNPNGDNCYRKYKVGPASYGGNPSGQQLERRDGLWERQLGGPYATSAILVVGPLPPGVIVTTVPPAPYYATLAFTGSATVGGLTLAITAGSTTGGSGVFTTGGAASPAASGTSGGSGPTGGVTSTGGSGATVVPSPTGGSGTTHTSTATHSTTTETGLLAPCPSANGTTYVTDDASFAIYCDVSFNYQDVSSTDAATFLDCLSACADYIPPADGAFANVECAAVTFDPSNDHGDGCYLHGAGYTVTTAAGEASAQLVGAGAGAASGSASAGSASASVPAASSAGSASSSSAAAGGAGSTSPSSSAASSPPSSAAASPSSSVSSASSVSVSSVSSASASPSSSAPPSSSSVAVSSSSAAPSSSPSAPGPSSSSAAASSSASAAVSSSSSAAASSSSSAAVASSSSAVVSSSSSAAVSSSSSAAVSSSSSAAASSSAMSVSSSASIAPSLSSSSVASSVSSASASSSSPPPPSYPCDNAANNGTTFTDLLSHKYTLVCNAGGPNPSLQLHELPSPARGRWLTHLNSPQVSRRARHDRGRHL